MTKKKDFRKDLKAIRRRYKELLSIKAGLEGAIERLAEMNTDMNEAIAERAQQNHRDRKQIGTNEAKIKESAADLKEIEAEIAELDQAIDDIADGL